MNQRSQLKEVPESVSEELISPDQISNLSLREIGVVAAYVCQVVRAAHTGFSYGVPTYFAREAENRFLQALRWIRLDETGAKP